MSYKGETTSVISHYRLQTQSAKSRRWVYLNTRKYTKEEAQDRVNNWQGELRAVPIWAEVPVLPVDDKLINDVVHIMESMTEVEMRLVLAYAENLKQ